MKQRIYGTERLCLKKISVLGISSVVDHLPRMCKALVSVRKRVPLIEFMQRFMADFTISGDYSGLTVFFLRKLVSLCTHKHH
jgi:hypothetical protein